MGNSLAFLVAYLGPELMENFQLSRGELGLLIGLFFGGTGVASLGLLGAAAGLGARRLVSVGMGLATVAYVLIGMADFYGALLIAALVAGVGYAFVNIGSNLAVVAASPVRRIGINMGIKTAGIPTVATAIAVCAPLASNRYGYQAVCLAFSVMTLVTMTATLWFLGAVQNAYVKGKREGALPPGFFWIPISAFFLVAGSQPLLSWIVTYGHHVGPYSLEAAGVAVALGSCSGTVSMLFIAGRSDIAGSASRATFVAAACALAGLGAVVVWLGGPHSIAVLALGAVLGISGTMVAVAMTHALVADRATSAVGRGSSLTLAGYYAGAAVSPFIFGFVADGPGGYPAAWGGSAVVLALATCGFWRLRK